jgi:hypothetical protein
MVRRLRGRIWWIAALLALAALACNLPAAQSDATVTPTVTDLPGEGETPQPTATGGLSDATPAPDGEPVEPTADGEPILTVAVPPTAGALPDHGEAIYTTDFTSGWTTVTSERDGEILGSATITPDGYLFEVAKNWGHWVFTTRADAGAFYAEITAVPQACPAGRGAYGLLFHHVDNSTFRAFMVTCGGGYALRESTASGDDDLAAGSLPEGIDPSTGEHTLAVQAYQDSLTLFVDGIGIDAVSVADLPAGDFGPYTETGDDPITILFTRLEVYEPE